MVPEFGLAKMVRCVTAQPMDQSMGDQTMGAAQSADSPKLEPRQWEISQAIATSGACRHEVGARDWHLRSLDVPT